jgi:hypothetical protein
MKLCGECRHFKLCYKREICYQLPRCMEDKFPITEHTPAEECMCFETKDKKDS